MSNSYVIETPENIAFGYDVAGIGSRFLATLIDSLIQATLYVILLVTLALAEYVGAAHALPADLATLPTAAIILALFIIQFGYFLLFELFMHGQTPGKRLFNLQVVKENGYPLSAVDSIIRNLVRIIDFFPVGYGVGLIVMFLNARARRLGDYAAGTIVVKLRDDVKLADLAAPPAPGVPTPELAGLENLRPSDVELITSYLRRRHEIRDATKLGGAIARAIQWRMNAPQTDEYAANFSHDDFLLQVVSAYRRVNTRTG